MKLWFAFFIIFGIFSSSKAVNVSLVEFELAKMSNELINQEMKLTNLVLICNSTARAASSNLNASNFPKDVLSALNDFTAITTNLLIIKNIEKLSACGQTADCRCMDFRLFMIQSQIMQFEFLINSGSENATTLYSNLQNIIFEFMVNFKQLEDNWTRRVLLLSLFTRTSAVLNQFASYLEVLRVGSNFLFSMVDYLSDEWTSSSCIIENSTLASDGDKIDDDLRAFEQDISNLSLTAWEKVNISLSTVASARKVAATAEQKPPLQQLSNTYKAMLDSKSSFKVKWPRIPDKTGRATFKVQTCQAKKTFYGFTSKRATQYKDRIKKNLDDLNAKVSSTAKKVQAASADISAVITSTTDVINAYTSYINGLNAAFFKAEEMSQNISVTLCIGVQDIFNSNSYMKTACRFGLSNCNQSCYRDYCQSIGMRLYQIVTMDDFHGIYQAAFKMFGTNSANGLLLDGYRASNGTWFVDNQKLLSSITPSTATGRCLSLGQMGSRLSFHGNICSTTANGYCEFVKVTQVPFTPKTTPCRNISEIRDATGKYLKSACIIDVAIKAPGSVALCRMNAMNAFLMKTAADLNGLTAFISRVYGVGSNASFYISGTKTTTGWSVENGDDLFSGVIPKIVGGPRLIFKANRTEGVPDGWDYPVMCEFKLPGMDEPSNKSDVGYCGTFVKYDPVNARTNPSINGVPGGINFKDGSVQYVGYGIFNGCDTNLTHGTGYISTTAGSAGAYSACVGGEQFNATSAYYVGYHQDLSWVPANITTLANIPGQISINYNNFNLGFGRAIVNGNYILGRLYLILGKLVYTDPTGYKETTSNFEVLVCKSYPPCGTFEPFDTANALFGPASNGVSAGKYVDGSQAYVGYGDNSAAPCTGETRSPGRISINPASPGCYVSCMSARYSPNNNFYLRYHPNLLWLPAASNTVSNFATAIKIFTNTNVYFGRIVNFGFTYLGKPIQSMGYAFYFGNYSTETKIYSSFEVLTCAPNPVNLTVPASTANFSICASKRAIYDINGVYIKTACYVAVGMNYATAETNCRTAGMELYAITTADEYSGLLTFVQTISGLVNGPYMMIGGKYNSTDGKWYVFNPTQKPLLSGIVNGSYVSGNDCLRVSGSPTGYYVNAGACTSSNNFCEYN